MLFWSSIKNWLCLSLISILIIESFQLNIHRFKVIARFGLMHVVATNICVWIRTLVLEYLKEITVHYKEQFNSTMNFSGKSHIDIFYLYSLPCTNFILNTKNVQHTKRITKNSIKSNFKYKQLSRVINISKALQIIRQICYLQICVTTSTLIFINLSQFIKPDLT